MQTVQPPPFERMTAAEEKLHLTDLAFSGMCEKIYGVNRGVYNTIESWFYAAGLTHIMERRRTVLAFLEFLAGRPDAGPTARLKLGHGGLKSKLHQFCLQHPAARGNGNAFQQNLQPLTNIVTHDSIREESVDERRSNRRNGRA